MTEDDSSLMGSALPTEQQQRPTWKTRLKSNAYILFLNVVISGLILTFAVGILTDTAKNIRNGKELARYGRLAYTDDVDSGGRGQSTVYYSFTYEGRLYRGEKLLPRKYVNRISDYRKSGNFPVLFLPDKPSVNHPYDWHGDESYSSALVSYLLIAVLIVQWTAWTRFIVRGTDRPLTIFKSTKR